MNNQENLENLENNTSWDSLVNKYTQANPGPTIITLASGKGGVGKTTVSVNLAISLAHFGMRVLVVDADFGLANIDVMLGVQTKYNLSHFIRGQRRLDEIVHIGYDGVRFISGGSGLTELLQLDERQLGLLLHNLTRLEAPVDYIICDAGAGISENIMQLVEASSATIVVTTPEPTAILDAYALIKTIVVRDKGYPISVIMNRVESDKEAQHVLKGFTEVLSRHLNKEIKCLGHILNEPDVSKSIKRQTPILISAPDSKFSRDVKNITRALLELPPAQEPRGALARIFSGLFKK